MKIYKPLILQYNICIEYWITVVLILGNFLYDSFIFISVSWARIFLEVSYKCYTELRRFKNEYLCNYFFKHRLLLYLKFMIFFLFNYLVESTTYCQNFRYWIIEVLTIFPDIWIIHSEKMLHFSKVFKHFNSVLI